MWFLVPKEAPDDRLHLPVGKELIVGRSGGHVTIDDRSVSRKQAILTVKSNEVDCRPVSSVRLRDTSRFGSFVNGQKIVQDERELADGDTICFGIPTGIQFNLVYEPLVVCASTISSSVKSEIRKTLQFLGGELVLEWSQRCTLLVMSRVSITIKVIGALIQGACIVSPDFIFHLRDFHSGKRSSAPEARDYQPVITQDSQHLENTELDLLPRPQRRELFKGDTFVFMTRKRYDRLASTLELGGARCLLWESEDAFKKDGGEETVSKALVFYEESATSFHRRIFNILKKQRRRPIVDAEIGYAVLACSKDDYCEVTKRCDLLSRHGISDISFSQLESTMSQSMLDRRNDDHTGSGDTSLSILEENPMTSATAAESSHHLREEDNEFAIKQEVDSNLEQKPDVLVPQTPPYTSVEEAPDVTNVTTVACSLEAKVEEPWGDEATELPEEEAEDPFDRLPVRKRRRHTESSRQEPDNPPKRSHKTDESSNQLGGEETVSVERQDATPFQSVPKKELEEEEKGENVGEEEKLPRNCGQVKLMPLMRKRGPPPRATAHNDGPNFKRFRKIAQPGPGRTRSVPVLIANSRAEMADVEESEQPASQSERSHLDSQADRLFEEMRRVAPGRRR